MSDSMEAAEDEDGKDAVIANWMSVKSAFPRHMTSALPGSSTFKAVAPAGTTVASTAISATSMGMGVNSLAVAGAIAAGAAVSATGVGLVVAGGALTVASMSTNIVSMVKSTSHVVKLKEIRSNVGNYAKCTCQMAARPADMSADHAFIADKVLSYIITQKTEKAVKKGVGIVPGGGLGTSIYRFGRFAFKTNRSIKRSFYANVLTRHLVTHDCALAGAIVAQLFSTEEMFTLRQFGSDEAGPIIAKKMKSV